MSLSTSTTPTRRLSTSTTGRLRYLPSCILRSASWMVNEGGACRVRRHDTHHRARLGVEARSDDTQDDVLGRKDAGDLARDGATAADLAGARTVPVDSMTQTAVVWCSFMRRAASRTVVRTPTQQGSVRESRMDERSGMLIFWRSASMYWSMACCGPASRPTRSGRPRGRCRASGGAVGAFELLERLVEHLCDVEQADDVAVLVADGR